MTLLLAPQTDELEQVSSHLWRVSVDRYHEMLNAGSLTENDRLELLEGFLTEKMTINPLHTFITETIRETLAQIAPPDFFVNAQQPITTSDSEPEPDVIVIKGRRHDFLTNHPGPEDVALLVEVSDATLQQDQSWKKRIYARAAIVVYWIVNVPERQIEVYTHPSGPTSNPTYRQLKTYTEADAVPVVLNDREISYLPVSELFPAK